MSITAYQVTYTGVRNGYVPAVADRRMFNAVMPVKNAAGFIKSPSIVVSGLNITVTNGWGVIYGCQFLIDSETVSATATAGNYQLIVRLNVTNSTIEMVVQSASTPLVQEDINEGGSIYEMPVMTLTTNGVTISEYANVYTEIIPAGDIVHTLEDDVTNIQSSISSIQTSLSSKTNTKVKGNKESTYRTGNVNLTPANIGAVPTLFITDTFYAETDGFLSAHWSEIPIGLSIVEWTADASGNQRYMFTVSKTSASTGFATAVYNKPVTMDDGTGQSFGCIDICTLASGSWSVRSFFDYTFENVQYYTMTAENLKAFLNQQWGNLPTGVSHIAWTLDGTTNDRYMIDVWKVSSTTGQAWCYPSKPVTVSGNTTAVFYQYRKSGSNSYLNTFYADSTEG